MKKLFSVLVMAMLVATVSFAQTTNTKAKAEVVKATAQSGAQMKFTSTTVNYGTIAQNSDPFRIATFTNTGTEALIIKSAKGSCGCTIPTFPKEPIAPGATAEIKIKYDTKRLGAINKTVTIQSNAGVKILKVKGNITQQASTPKKEGHSILDQK
jgi:hypothetical protein